MRLPDWLAARAASSPDGLALSCAGPTLEPARFTYADLHVAASAVARRLAALDVVPGDRVALLLRNRAEFAALVHAAPRLQVVLVPLNTRLTPAELAWQVADSGARLLVHAWDEAPRFEGVRVVHVGELERGGEADVALADSIDLDAVHTIVYTSGSSGRPKGAMLTYGNHWWSAVGSALNLGLRPDDRWLAVLPLFHVGGLAILLRSAIYGTAALVHEAFDPAAVNRAIDEEGVTIVSVVSAMLARMLDERGPRPYPPSLRCVLLGGGPAPRPLLEECARRGCPVLQTYGLTETASQVVTLAPTDALRKLGSAGRPLLPMAVRIEGAGRPAPPGEVGEILVCGPSVMAGYAGDPERTAATLRSGWLHTGDLGYLDAEGYLYVVDRRDDLIISGGENVYPAEVEATLLAHPAIAQAGVVGVPDARWGQVPVAVVVLRTGARQPAPDEVIAFCATRLARYKLPTRVRFVEDLPRSANGKLLRRVLREWASAPLTP